MSAESRELGHLKAWKDAAAIAAAEESTLAFKVPEPLSEGYKREGHPSILS